MLTVLVELLTIYVGEMLWAVASGPLAATEHQRRYVGSYVNGRRHGKGEMMFPNGDIYTGGYMGGSEKGN